MIQVGEKIRKIRDLKGLSQENVADLLGLSLPAYADIERRKKDVTLSRLVTIALKTPTPPYFECDECFLALTFLVLKLKK